MPFPTRRIEDPLPDSSRSERCAPASPIVAVADEGQGRDDAATTMVKWVEDEKRLDWFVVPLHKVEPGDRYANHATVTKSRKARSTEAGRCSVNGEPVGHEDCWHIECGKSMSVTAHRGRPVVIGRRNERPEAQP